MSAAPTASRLRPLALAAFALLTACGGGGDDGTVTTAGDGAWRITPDGFGPLKAGMTVAEAATAVGSAFTRPRTRRRSAATPSGPPRRPACA